MLAAHSEGILPDVASRKQLLLLLLLLLGAVVPGEPFGCNSAAFCVPYRAGTHTIKGSKTRMEVQDTGSTGVASVAVRFSASVAVLSSQGTC